MKYTFSVFIILLLLGCASKRNAFRSIPVLLDYILFCPDEALERGLEGKVMLSILVTEDRKAEDVKSYKTSGYYLLDSAALRIAKTFVFSPAALNNKLVGLQFWSQLNLYCE